MKTLRAVATLIWTVISAGASADQDRTINITFPAGKSGTTINENVSGHSALLFRVGAEAGQTMRVSMTASNLATSFNLYAPGDSYGGEAFVIGQVTDPSNFWMGEVSTSGIYTIAVFLFRSAAQNGEKSDITLEVSVTGEREAVVQSDFADGLAGGPDFWVVSVSEGTLNLRNAPSAGANIAAQLPNRTRLRNLGCRIAEGRRWCRVAILTEGETEGWTAGDFLREAPGPPTK